MPPKKKRPSRATVTPEVEPRDGFSVLTASQVEEVAPQLSAIEDRDGELTPNTVLQEARATPGSALHAKFTWDDSVAAEKQRLTEARRVIRSIQIVYKKRDGERLFTGPQYVSVTRVSRDAAENEIRRRAYISAERALADPDTRAEMTEDALRRMRYWRQQFQSLRDSELAPIFRAFARVEKGRG